VIGVLFFANVVNLAADIAAMAEAVHLVLGGPVLLYSILFGAVCLLAEMLIPYDQFAGFLKWGALVLFVYVASAFTIRVPVHQILAGALIPSIKFSATSFTALTAVLGTTISPYLFFWQASMEVQKQKIAPLEGPLIILG
jgi:Mn2+/Fe2+ NRAMP family transporter